MARSKYSRRRSHHKRIALASGASAAEGPKPDAAPSQDAGKDDEQDTPGLDESAARGKRPPR